LAKSARKSQTEVNRVPRFANPDPGFATKPEVIFSTSNLRIKLGEILREREN
jgi:hypothetical protein